MYTKNRSYKQALKQAISEWDTTKTVDVKGPMLDGIISYKGDGELPIYKDAASILERYYFNEQEEKPLEYDPSEGAGDLDTKEMEHGEGTGTQQAGTSDEKTIAGMKDEHEEEIAKEMYSIFENEDEYDEKKAEKKAEKKEEEEENDEEKTDSEKEVKESISLWFSEQEHDENKETMEDEVDETPETQEKEREEGKEKHLDVDEKMDEEDNKKVTESMENAIIEKLIDEMEAMTYTGTGVKPSMEAPEEKESKDPEEHATGAGTEQAGTGDAEGEIPDRKDLADKMVDPKEYTDEWLNLMEQELEKEEDGEKELESDRDMEEDEEKKEEEKEKKEEEAEKKEVKESFPSPIKISKLRSQKNPDAEYMEEMASLKHVFQLFSEDIK